MEYSPDFKKNFATAYLAEEYERIDAEKREGLEAAGEDPDLKRMAEEDATRLEMRQQEILLEIDKIEAKTWKRH